MCSKRKILKKKYLKIFDTTNAGDAGGSWAQALLCYRELDKPRNELKIKWKDLIWDKFDNNSIEKSLRFKANYVKKSSNEVCSIVKELSTIRRRLVSRKNGIGPRALGGRSILADPRSENAKELNLKLNLERVLDRFAPSVLEDLSNWFEMDYDGPYMLSFEVKKDKQIKMSKDKKLFGIEKLNVRRSSIPAITHVDYSARIQTVHKN